MINRHADGSRTMSGDIQDEGIEFGECNRLTGMSLFLFLLFKGEAQKTETCHKTVHGAIDVYNFEPFECRL